MAPSTTNYAEIQHDEIEALRSIYMDDFVEEERKTGAWNKAIDRTFKIKLRATDGDEQEGIALVVSLPPTYPKSLPHLTIDCGLETRQKSRSQAEEMLKMKPKSLVGSEMIFELASSLQDILDNTWVNPNETVALDTERTAKEQAALEKARVDDEIRQQRELQLREEEELTLQELVIQHESRSTKRIAKSPQSPSNGLSEVKLPAGAMKFERPSCGFRTPGGRTITIDIIHDRVRYRQGPTCEVFSAWPFGQDHGTYTGTMKGEVAADIGYDGPFLALKDCYIPSSSGGEASLKRAVQNLESKLEFHMGLGPHQSIMKPLNFHIQKVFDDHESTAYGWKVTILTELAQKRSLQETLDIVDKLDVKLIRAWSIQLIEGLQHYHRNGVAHGNVHLGNILLQRDLEAERGKRKITIAMLSDGGYQRHLHLLKTGSGPEYFPLAWTAPEAVNASSAEEAIPATDIWDFGRCFCQMAFGVGILTENPSGPQPLIEELRLTSSLKALLNQMFDNNPKKRSSAWDLLHFEFFRNDDALFEGTSVEDSLPLEASTSSMPTSHLTRSRRESIPASLTSSRYAKDFVEDGRLGRGGFGEVFRARNKVDGQPYAIKKVKARSRGALDPVLSEVTVLSRLNHPNVVRYFASWIEDGVSIEKHDPSESSEEEYTSSLNNARHRPILPASSRGLDFISSTDDHVVFAADDDEEATSAEENEDDSSGNSDDEGEVNGRLNTPRFQPLSKAGSSSVSAEHSEAHVQEQVTWTILYIQMEYCKQETLRDLINSGLQANVTEMWRFFRQIVQGLAHIHGLSIVHRDLKPENIFIDSEGDVRIGDFGLARPGDYRTVVNQSHTNGTTPREIFGSFTKDIGTASYVAPEVRSAGNGKYDEKADMFSLGVILLEMNVPFSTGMERAETLAQLQKDNHTLPIPLLIPEKGTQAKIALSLLHIEPSQRPSSSDLLDGGEIPGQAEDESLRMARRLLNDRSSQYRSQFIGGLFTQEEQTGNLDSTRVFQDPMQVVSLLDDVGAMSLSSTNNLELQAMVKEKLVAVCQRHGAVERTDSPALFPCSPYYSADDVVRFMNPTGKVMQLPYDLILPNAMLLARRLRPERKTFIFDNVYRVDHTKDQPNIFEEANFDIVSGKGDNLALREAEVLKFIDEILDTFPTLSISQMCYHINHSQLLDNVLQFCDINPFKWPMVKETISKLHTGEWTWAKVRHELRGPSIAVAATSLDELERFDFRDTCDKAIPRIRSIFKDSSQLEATFAHLNAVISFLTRLGVRRRVYVSPLSSYNEKFYSGNLLFQCLYDQKRRSVFAAGGRYDQLVRTHQPVVSRRAPVHAVGCQLAWTGLCGDIANYFKKIAKSKAKKRSHDLLSAAWRTRRCNVLVKSFDQGLLESVGVEILQELWANNISSEVAESNLEEPADSIFTKTPDRSDEHNWTILIKSDDLVKVKNTTRGDEIELKVFELTGYMRGELRERDRMEERSSKIPLIRHSSQQEPHVSTNDRDLEIRVFTSLNKGKKVNRRTIIEEAKRQKQAYIQNCADSPIVAIETKEDTFEAFAETRLSDPESWKRFIQDAAPGERAYLGGLQNLLKSMAKEVTQGGNSSAIVYNFRTKACVCYNLGRAT